MSLIDRIKKFDNELIDTVCSKIKDDKLENEFLEFLCKNDVYHYGPNSGSYNTTTLNGEEHYTCRFCDKELIVTINGKK